MEQGPDALQILDRQGRLVDLYQIIRNGMAQEVNIFFHIINFRDFFFIQCNQRIHGPVEILAGERRHTVQLLNYFHNSRCRVEDHLFTDIFQLMAVAVTDLFVAARHEHIGQFHDRTDKRRHDNHLEQLDRDMRIGHYPARILMRGVRQNRHHLMNADQKENVYDYRSDHIKDQMNGRGSLGILFTG